MIARAVNGIARRILEMFSAGWLISLGVAIAMIGAWLFVSRNRALVGFAVAGLVALALVADAAMTARRSQ